MKKNVLLVGLILFACATPRASASVREVDRQYLGPSSAFLVLHDDARAVTCWAFNEMAITCIPDWQFSPPKSGATP